MADEAAVELEDVDNFDEEEFERALASGDPDEIDKLLAGDKSDDKSGSSPAEPDVDDGEQDTSEDDPDESKDDPDETEEDDDADKDAKPDMEEKSDEDTDSKQADDQDDENAVIKAQDGKREIPYSELKKARQQAQEYSRKLEAKSKSEQELQDKLDQLTRHNEVLADQLKRNKLDPERLPEEAQIDSETLDYLDEVDPKLAGVVRTMARQNEYLMRQFASRSEPESKSTADDPVLAAIERNEDLNAWRNQPTKWKIATEIDDALREDPTFADKTLDERFEEVARRVRIRLGESPDSKPDPKPSEKDAKPDKSAQEKAREKLAEADNKVPQSLTDVGQSSDTQRPLVERLASMDAEQIAQYMLEHNLSAEQMDEMINSAG